MSFNSRTLGRVRQPMVVQSNYYEYKFQFTHPGKGATGVNRVAEHTSRVSIHAPWEGCDLSLK